MRDQAEAVSADGLGEPNPRGQAMVDELLWIHGIIRTNLDAISELLTQVEAGAGARQIQDEIVGLKSVSIIWNLRYGCLQYCRFVHSHHHLEDVAVFPGLRRVNPGLAPIIQKLEADHRVVGVILDRIEAEAPAIDDEDGARGRLETALSELREVLLTHLDFEEENITPTLRRLREWPLP